MTNSHLVLDFWFVQCTPKMWFKKSKEFDELIKHKFMKTIETHLKTNIKDFIVSRETYISSIIVLDQFTRNVFRNSAKAYQGDEKQNNYVRSRLKNNFFKKMNIIKIALC